MTLVCVPIYVESTQQALADAREARDGGADLVEFRVDSFFTGLAHEQAEQADEIAALVSQAPLACIVTCRPVLEGGQYDGPDDARIALYERLCAAAAARGTEHAPRYIDVELATYTRSENIRQKVNLAVDHPGQLRPVETGLILSSHDFHTRPPDLFRQIERMLAEPACRVMKIAYRARSLRDNLELLDILAAARETGRPAIALGMGPFGLLSRVLAPKFDGFLTFASLRRDSGTAPGQPVLRELLETYRFRSIGPATSVLGVVGATVDHSLSPHVHNAGFEALGRDAVYLPMPVPPEYEHFKATVLAMLDHPHLDLSGLSVTIPHKEHLVRLAREQAGEAGAAGTSGDAPSSPEWSLDALSERCGSANTLIVRRDPKGRPLRMEIRNTDGPAAADLLDAARTVLVAGVGGTARAVAAELMHRGRRVLLLNRTHDKAVALADELSRGSTRGGAPAPVRAVTREEAVAAAGTVDAVMNCTPVGMRSGSASQAAFAGGDEELSIPEQILGNLPPHALVSDAVYSPRTTPLLRAAASRGLCAVDGVALFVAQAAAQFECWTARPAPRALFERVVGETLAARG